MASPHPALLAFALVLGTSVLACGSTPGAATGGATANGGTETSSASVASNGASGSGRDVHSIYLSRCGNCHVRVAPGTHTRGQLETAFTRHHARVKMNDAEWSSMVDFLASDAPRSAMAAPLSGPTARSSAKSTSAEK